MADNVTNLKVRFTGDLKPFKKEVDGGKALVQQFSKQSTSAIEHFGRAFGINTNEIKQGFGSIQNSIKSMVGGFRSAGAGAGIFTRALKVLKTALISTGIGALVVALGSLVSYFTKTQRGADKVKQVMAGLKAVFNVLIDRLSAFGEGLWKILTGRFKEGWEALKGSIKGVGQEIREESRAARELEKASQALEDREIALIEVQARRRKEIAALRLEEKDETKTAQERLEALNKAIKLEEQSLADEMSLQKERVRILEQQIALGESTREDYRQLAEAKAKIHELEEKSMNFQRELAERRNTLTRAIQAQTDALVEQQAVMMTMAAPSAEGTVKVTGGIDIDTSQLADMSAVFEEIRENIRRLNEELGGMSANLGQVLEQALEDVAINMGELLGLLAVGQNVSGMFTKALIEPFADMSIKLGKMIIADAIAVKALQNALKFGNPVVAVAAGMALIALGTAIKSSLASVASSMGGGGGISISALDYNYDTRRGSNLQPQTMRVEVVGEFVQRGTDLVAVINRENNRKISVT